jgi:cytosine/adenosine deaminase-related metal-dependent hydrolase
VIDHHASPGCIPGSLAALAGGVEQVGLRGVYCYEVTDRHGEAGAEAGIAENLAFLDGCARAAVGPAGPRRAGLLGAHASFTLGNRTLDLLASRAEYGLHIHLAEDPADAVLSRQRYRAAPLARLARRGLLGPRTLLAHGVHLRPRDLEAIAGSGATLVHCYRSNLNNSVGLPPAAAAAAAGIPLALGTDGMDGSLLDELKAAFYAHQAESLGQGYAMASRYLEGNAALVARHLPGVELGEVAEGRPADLTLWRYPAAGAMLPGRTLGHLLFGLSPARLHATMVGGRFVYRDGRYPLLGDPEPHLAEARDRMRALWRRMESPPRRPGKTAKRGPA